MRASPLDERGSLTHAEAVLLVDHGHGEVSEVDLLLDQRVRSDDERRVARCDQLAHRSTLARTQRAREQRDPHAERRAELVDREEVLLGERLGRSHERPLPSGFDRAQERMEGHDRLPRAHLALQEALHRGRALEVGVDLRDRALLVERQRERERRAIAVDQLTGLGQGIGGGSSTRSSRARQGDLQHEQLLEREPHASGLGLVERAWPVQGNQGVGAQRKTFAREERRRQRLPGIAHEWKRLRAKLAQLLLRDVLARGVHGREVGSLDLALEVVRRDGEAELVRTSSQPNARAWRQALLEPGLVEPRRLDLPARIGDARGENLQPAAPATGKRSNLDVDHGLFVAEELADELRGNGLFVAPRSLPEKIADLLDADPGESSRKGRADSVQALDGRLEALRPRDAARAGPGVGGTAAGEAGSRTTAAGVRLQPDLGVRSPTTRDRGQAEA